MLAKCYITDFHWNWTWFNEKYAHYRDEHGVVRQYLAKRKMHGVWADERVVAIRPNAEHLNSYESPFKNGSLFEVRAKFNGEDVIVLVLRKESLTRSYRYNKRFRAQMMEKRHTTVRNKK